MFLSHNSANKAYASRVAAALQLLGANVWFDAWKIRPGDSIPAAINQGLADFDVFVLLWSALGLIRSRRRVGCVAATASGVGLIHSRGHTTRGGYSGEDGNEGTARDARAPGLYG